VPLDDLQYQVGLPFSAPFLDGRVVHYIALYNTSPSCFYYRLSLVQSMGGSLYCNDPR